MNGKQKMPIRIVGIAFIIFGVLFGGTINRYHYCLGDTVLSALGISAWSNETTGTHYSAIIGVIAILIGEVFVNITVQEDKRTIVWVIAIVTLMVLNFVFRFI